MLWQQSCLWLPFLPSLWMRKAGFRVLEWIDLRQWVEYYHGLVGARDHGLGNCDEFCLLAEHAQPRRLDLAAIQLRGRARRQFHSTGLNLRGKNIEFATVAHFLFEYRQNIGPRII